ncbi:MAG: hypothetical protein M4D85_07155, partial [Actinomycetota bacterium]|nr:hypothetical protein [Actinomycetota bacterium]
MFKHARDERGNTMAAVMGVMLVGGLLAAAAIASPTKDVGLSRFDQDYKDALAAAEAGVADYIYHLNRDNAYWSKCTDVAYPNAVNQVYDGSGPTRWRNVPGTPTKPGTPANTYAIELLPANGYRSCLPRRAQESIIDDDTGMFRIRVTGRARNAKRTITVTFKRRNFLDYLYFTDLETTDPVWYDINAYGRPTDPNIVAWASENCAKTYWRQGRGSLRYNGTFTDDNTSLTASCGEIQFAPGDVIAGPLHTNDEILTCGSPKFGRSPQDRVEVSAPAPGWRTSCGGTPDFIGTWSPNSPLLTLPPSNSSLKKIVEPGYLFTGATEIFLDGNGMRVTNAAAGLENVGMLLPPNGVVYIQNGECGQGYRPLDPYGNAPGCADVRVRGTYGDDLTLASEKDIIIDGDINRTADTMAGLIANNFVRVYHPVVGRNKNNPYSCQNGLGTMQSVRIDAAILALQHSFLVDNYYCGRPLQTLSVTGAIAQ